VHDVLALADTFRVATVAWSNDKPFSFIATAPQGVAKRSRTPERIRDAVAEANSQFKNAIKYKEAPCLLTIFHDAVDVPEEIIITSALYGDLKCAFSPERAEDGKLILDSNGAWNPNKNRTTSAVMYIRNDSKPLIVLNYWANRRFPRCMFSSKEIVLLDDGTFQQIDSSLDR
jgi:hypothetical protein